MWPLQHSKRPTTMSERTPGEISSGFADLKEGAALLVQAKPNLAMAAVTVAIGVLAILTRFPTKDGSATLAGALFGAAAIFIGAWVTESTKAAAERAALLRRQQAARAFFTPELARIAAQQVHILDRLIVNFGEASLGRVYNEDPLISLRPQSPLLYPGAAQFGDLPELDAVLLVDFYDASHGVSQTVDSWIENKTKIDFNAYNVLMQMVMHSLKVGVAAIDSFCPDRQYSPLVPVAGKLVDRIEKSIDHARNALAAHLKRSGVE